MAPPRGWTLQTSVDIAGALGVPQAVRRGLFAAAEVGAGTWRAMLSRPGSGRLYDRALRTLRRRDGSFFVGPVAPRVPHRASAPGEPPAPDRGASGGLLGSVNHIELDPNARRVGSSAPHAAIQEFGFPPSAHPAGIGLEPRPHARPAMAESIPGMNAAMARELAAVGGSAGGFRGRLP